MPSKLKVLLSGEGGKLHSGVGGTYYIQRRKINGKIHWIHQSRGFAIWWDDNSDPPSWMIGEFSNLGSTRSKVHGPGNDARSPTKIKSGWKYLAYDGWYDIPQNDLQIADWTNKIGSH